MDSETALSEPANCDKPCGRWEVSELIVRANQIQRPERLDYYSSPPARRPYTTHAEQIGPGTWLIVIKWDPPSRLGLQGGERALIARGDICRVALARAFNELWTRFPTCSLVYGCLDVYSTQGLYSGDKQLLPCSRDGAMTLKTWHFFESSHAVRDGDRDGDRGLLLVPDMLQEWKSVVPLNYYNPKEWEWCRSQKPTEGDIIRMGRPLVSSVSREDGPDGYSHSPLLALGSCSLCGRDHPPYPGV